MTRRLFSITVIAIGFSIVGQSGSASVRLPALLSDHLVLQKGPQTAIWGTANPNESVRVTLGNIQKQCIAKSDGRWQVTLDLTHSASGPFELIIEGENRLVISDVIVGEVWLASGQSNMAFPLKGALTGKKDAEATADPDIPQIREFRVPPRESDTPLEECEGCWVTGKPDTSLNFSAVAYYFASGIQKKYSVPMGIINASCNGTPVEAWLSKEGRAADPELSRYCEAQLERVAEAIAIKTKKWRGCDAPTALYNAMIYPISQMAIRGFIWYQGENNLGGAIRYRRSFPILIDDWRRTWNNHELPFYFCQLPDYKEKTPDIIPSGLAEMREAQDQGLKLSNTGRAVLIDTGEADNIHPPNKKDPGERLARIALSNTYKIPVPHESPRYDSMRIEDGRVRIFFKGNPRLAAHTLPTIYRSGGTTHPLVRNSPDSQLEGFIICGEDRTWKWAKAKIDDTSVIVWSPEVPHPVAVRYAWANNPTINLYDESGLPAAPFRTDSFPLSL
ncbi:MAG: sialate O-acetylesterase [Opitutaceae bacterium]|jgi:sialate O-acetylesterase|nr:sialate O-acetylesterase [Opitutaceae bacterium]